MDLAAVMDVTFYMNSHIHMGTACWMTNPVLKMCTVGYLHCEYRLLWLLKTLVSNRSISKDNSSDHKINVDSIAKFGLAHRILVETLMKPQIDGSILGLVV